MKNVLFFLKIGLFQAQPSSTECTQARFCLATVGISTDMLVC